MPPGIPEHLRQYGRIGYGEFNSSMSFGVQTGVGDIVFNPEVSQLSIGINYTNQFENIASSEDSAIAYLKAIGFPVLTLQDFEEHLATFEADKIDISIPIYRFINTGAFGRQPKESDLTAYLMLLKNQFKIAQERLRISKFILFEKLPKFIEQDVENIHPALSFRTRRNSFNLNEPNRLLAIHGIPRLETYTEILFQRPIEGNHIRSNDTYSFTFKKNDFLTPQLRFRRADFAYALMTTDGHLFSFLIRNFRNFDGCPSLNISDLPAEPEIFHCRAAERYTAALGRFMIFLEKKGALAYQQKLFQLNSSNMPNLLTYNHLTDILNSEKQGVLNGHRLSTDAATSTETT